MSRIVAATISLLIGFCAVAVNHSFSYLTIKDGLSQSTVKSIHQDYKGYMWFGTADGLNRYDGYRFTVYRNNPSDENTICGNDISVIYEDPADSALWIGTQSDGLNRYNRTNDTFVRYRKQGINDGSLPSNEITAIERQSGGKLWIATKYGGLAYFSSDSNKFIKPTFASDARLSTITSICFDRHGNMWLGTPNGLFAVTPTSSSNYDNATVSQPNIHSLQSVSINAIIFDRRGLMWIGTNENGLLRYNTESRKLITYQNETEPSSLKARKINCIAQQRNGDIWIGTYEGLFCYGSATNSFTSMSTDPTEDAPVNDEVIFSIFEDRSGILWLGAYFGGINKLDPNEFRFSKFSNINKLFGLSKAANNVKSIFKDSNTTLWVATSKGLVAFGNNYLENKEKSSRPQIYFADLDQHMVFGDRANNIYVSNHTGVHLKKSGSAQFNKFSPDLKPGTPLIASFNHAIEDADRTLWFLTPKGIYKYSPASNILELIHPVGELLLNANDFFITATEASDGKIWLGSFYGRLFHYNKNTNTLTEANIQSSLTYSQPYNRIFSICEQTPGQIWFGTNNGLYSFDEKNHSIKILMESDGLPNNVVYSVMTDKKGRIWSTTNLGISVFDGSKNTFTNYTWEDGLQSNEFNQSAYFKTAEGTIYAGGINGFNIIEPEKITPNEFVPPIVFTSVSVLHRPITPFTHPELTDRQSNEIEELTLAYNEAILTFEFAALNFIHPSKNQYRYKLDGYDSQWINANTARQATYTNIPPGKYTFMVEGSNNNGIWNPNPAKISVTIEPPFWQTWWFITIMATVILASTYVIFVLRHRRIRRKSAILKQLVLQKTANLTEKNRQINEQYAELARINDQIKERNIAIEEQNNKLNIQNEQIANQRDSLIRLSTELKEINQAKINFFTNISHEFRTPLTLIINPLKELADNIETTNKAEIQRKFRIVYGNASKLLNLVNQLLDFRNVDAGNIKLNISKQDIVAFTRQIFLLFNDIAETNKVTFTFTSSLPKAEICFDQEKMEKIVYNLLSNAFKNTHENGIISIELNIENESLKLTVTDNGRGYSEEDLSMIFEPFRHKHLNTSNPNSEIGLAIIKKYTELHNGTVKVKSRLGDGCQFTIEIPVTTDCANNIKPAVTPLQLTNEGEILMSSFSNYSRMMMKEQKTDSNFSLPRLLIVDSDNDLRAYLREILSPAFRVEEASAANEALTMVEKTNPDLVICDTLLSGKTGYEFCSTIKNNQYLNHIPVILLSSINDTFNNIKALNAGSDAIIQKPFDIQHLMAAIENILIQRKRLKERFFNSIGAEQTEVSASQADQAFLTKVTELVEQNIANPEFDVDAMCNAINLSQPQTYRKIKALTNLSINEFIRNIRLKKAAHLLATSNNTISEIAYQVGFGDPNYFTKCFVKLYGYTPSDFIKLKH